MKKQSVARDTKIGCFVGTAEAYAQYRPPYPNKIIQTIVDEFSLNGTQKIMDVGCGTGLFSIPLSKYTSSILAVDRDEDMISTAQKETSKMNIKNISYRAMSGEEIDKKLGTFDLAVFGTSFHWMDRNQIAEKLYTMLSRRGGVAILTAFYIWHGNEPWKETVRKTITSFTGEDRSAGIQGLSLPENDKKILSDAGFYKFKERNLTLPHDYTLNNLIGFLSSTSYASRTKLGNNADIFEKTLRTKLASEFGDDKYTEQVKYKLLTAHKKIRE